jgi:hypothetical protein
MSIIVKTSLGRFRRVNTGDPANPDTWLFECPGCGQWAYLDADQWAGRVSVDHASAGCLGGYHETHNYGAELVAAMQARILMGEKPFEEDTDGR